jgi:hypothetical protein
MICRIIREVTPAKGFAYHKGLELAVIRRLTALRIPWTYAQLSDAVGMVQSNTVLVRPPAKSTVSRAAQDAPARPFTQAETCRILNEIQRRFGRRIGPLEMR